MYQQPIIVQPTQGGANYINTNLSPGLERLLNVDQLFVKQKVDLFEAIFSLEMQNQYQIFDKAGQEVFFASEESDCCTRLLCGPHRPFGMTIKDRRGIEVIHLNRPLALACCCFICIPPSISVQVPSFNNVGSVEQEWSCLMPRYIVKDASGNVVLRIEGPCCTVSCCGDVEFKVLSADGAAQVGKISKKWSGLARELFTDADIFGISFPMDLDVKMKAVMIGACMLIDFMFFESNK